MRTVANILAAVKMRVGVTTKKGRALHEAGSKTPPPRYDVAKGLRLGLPQVPKIMNGPRRTTPGAISGDAMTPAPPEELLNHKALCAERAPARGDRPSATARHVLGLYGGEPGAHEYRRTLSEPASRKLLAPGSFTALSPLFAPP